jgi:hypothetical protein
VEPRLHGSLPLAGPGRDLRRRMTLKVTEDDDHAVLGLQPVEGSLQGVAFGPARRPIYHGNLGRGVYGQGPDTPLAQAPPADVDEDPIEPGIENRAISQVIETCPSQECRVMHGILGIAGIAQYDGGQTIGTQQTTFCQPLEGQATGRLPVA